MKTEENPKPTTQRGKTERKPKKGFQKKFPKKQEGKGEPEFPHHNDPKFYTKYRELATNAARIAFNHRNGSKVQFNYGNTSINRNIDPLLIVEYVPIPGLSNSMVSGINVAANAAYKVLNRKYRGSPSGRYQSADLGISQFAIMDFYLSLAQAERIYGLCQEAKVNQRQLPREMVFALGYDYDRISNNLSDFRAKLNTIIVRAQVLCLVKGYPLMDHHLFLLSNVFKDKDTDRSNYFAYKKPGYWLWEPTSFTTGSAVHWVPNKTTTNIVQSMGVTRYWGLQDESDVITNLTNQLEPLLNDSDIDAMSADILALFENNGDGNLLKLSFLPEGYIVSPIFAAEALYQLHNTTCPSEAPLASSTATPCPVSEDVNNRYATEYPTSLIPTGDSSSNHQGLFIYQVDGSIRFNAVSHKLGLTQDTSGSMIVYGNATNNVSDQIYYPLIDTDVLNPSPDEVLEMTRNTTIWEMQSFTASGGSLNYRVVCRAAGTVMVTDFRLWEFGDVGKYTKNAAGDYTFSNFAIYDMQTTSQITTYLTRFDWAPIVCYVGQVYADLDNYRGIEFPILEVIHEAAVLSEFHNPISDILIKDI